MPFTDVDFYKVMAEHKTEVFRKSELAYRLKKMAIIAIIVLLCIGAEVIGYYWGN